MSDYPMLISNKLHSFRNFRGQNYFFYPLVVRFVSIFFMPGILYSSLIKYVLPFWVLPLPSFNESFCRLVSSLLCRRYSILR